MESILIEGDSANYVYTLTEPVRKVHCIELSNSHIPYTFNNVIQSNCSFKYTALLRIDLDLVIDSLGILNVEQLVRGATYTLAGGGGGYGGLFQLFDRSVGETAVFTCTFLADTSDVFEFEVSPNWADTLDYKFAAFDTQNITVVSYNKNIRLPVGYYNPVQLGSKILEQSEDANLAVSYLSYSNSLQFTHTTATYFCIWTDTGTIRQLKTINPETNETGFLYDTPRYIRISFENLNNSAAWLLIPITTQPKETVHMAGQTVKLLKLDPPQDIYKLHLILTDSDGNLLETLGQKHSLFFNFLN
jgi:hypothetical protein